MNGLFGVKTGDTVYFVRKDTSTYLGWYVESKTVTEVGDEGFCTRLQESEADVPFRCFIPYKSIGKVVFTDGGEAYRSAADRNCAESVQMCVNEGCPLHNPGKACPASPGCGGFTSADEEGEESDDGHKSDIPLQTE